MKVTLIYNKISCQLVNKLFVKQRKNIRPKNWTLLQNEFL